MVPACVVTTLIISSLHLASVLSISDKYCVKLSALKASPPFKIVLLSHALLLTLSDLAFL